MVDGGFFPMMSPAGGIIRQSPIHFFPHVFAVICWRLLNLQISAECGSIFPEHLNRSLMVRSGQLAGKTSPCSGEWRNDACS
jgi:hypothetical protein